MVREEAGLPSPKVYGLHHTLEGTLLVSEKMPGVKWSEFMDIEGHSLDSYLISLSYLGSDIARAEQVTFDTYGDVMGHGEVQPGNIRNFATRLYQITEHKMFRAQDIESLDQPKLEFHMIRLMLFNYYNEETMEFAENAFFSGFYDAGGEYNRDSGVNKELELILSSNWVLGAVNSYHGVEDGLRDEWSKQYKNLLFRAAGTGQMDYARVADIPRSKTMQPKQPSS